MSTLKPPPQSVVVLAIRTTGIEKASTLAICDLLVDNAYVVRAMRLNRARSGLLYVQASSLKIIGGDFVRAFEAIDPALQQAILAAVCAAYDAAVSEQAVES